MELGTPRSFRRTRGKDNILLSVAHRGQNPTLCIPLNSVSQAFLHVSSVPRHHSLRPAYNPTYCR